MVETSSAVKLSHKNGRFNAIFPIARKTVQRRLLVCCFHWQCLIKMYSKVLYRVLKRNAASSISTDSQPAKLLPFDEAKGMISDVFISFFFFFFFFFFFLSAFRLFVALSPWQIISYAGLNVWLSKKETPRWCTVRQLCVISILVILTAMGRYYGVCEYRLNSTGPRTDPWGTPKPRGVGEDIKPSTTTDCTLSVKPGRCYSWDPQSSLLVCLWHVSKSVLLLLLLFYISVLSMESVKFHCLGLPAMSVSGVCYRRVWKW